MCPNESGVRRRPKYVGSTNAFCVYFAGAMVATEVIGDVNFISFINSL